MESFARILKTFQDGEVGLVKEEAANHNQPPSLDGSYFELTPNGMYVITWRDHFSTEGFFSKDLEEFDGKALMLTSLGFYIKEDEHYYHFARTLGENVCADTMSIIKEQIVELDEIIQGG